VLRGGVYCIAENFVKAWSWDRACDSNVRQGTDCGGGKFDCEYLG
jgi:hypothetical protein